jgi:nitrate reductase cytochrome c-type subunit
MRNTFSILTGVAMLTGACLLIAADKEPAGADEKPSSAYNAKRSFAQPVREDPVGKKITTDRSFWGAPPPMPHTFTGDRDGKYCLTCHARETRIEKRQQAIAPVPHAEFSQCQQCHVNGSDKSVEVFRETLFVGLDFPGKGTRAHDYAPPTIPHKTFMRDNCLSCHGPAGKQKIESPHPYRSQCQQCHVSDATNNYDRPVPWAELDGEL